jgi:hypothetical protein
MSVRPSRGRRRLRRRTNGERVFAGTRGAEAWRASVSEPGSLRSDVRGLGPLPELGLVDFVDVHPDPANAAFIDLDLVQIRGRMREPLR